MAITLGMSNLIIDKTVISNHYPGGVPAFLRDRHGHVFGQDGEIIAIGFMQAGYAYDLRARLIEIGLPGSWMVVAASNLDSDDDTSWLQSGGFEMVAQDAAIRSESCERRPDLYLVWRKNKFTTLVQTAYRSINPNAPPVPQYIRLLPGRVEFVSGNIADVSADVLVNSTNVSLRPAGGVDGEIHRGAGARLKEELSRIDGCSVGDVIVTHAYDLKARYIIHAVGPRFGAEVCRESELLLSCYRRVFEECVLLGAVSVCFPTISTGINSFPASDAARVAIRATREFLAHTGFAITITFCCNSQLDHDSYQEALVEKPWIQS